MTELKRLSIFLLGAIIGGFGGPAWAQSGLRQQARPTNGQVPATTAQAAPSAPAVTQTPPPPPPPPQPTRTEILNFDNWRVTCQDFAEGKRRHICIAALQLIQSNNNQTILTWTLAAEDDGHWMMVLQVPTGVQLSPGVEVKLAKAATRTIPYASCETNHCTASAALDAGFSRELASSTDAVVTVRALNGNNVQFTIPLKGYDKAYAAATK